MQNYRYTTGPIWYINWTGYWYLEVGATAVAVWKGEKKYHDVMWYNRPGDPPQGTQAWVSVARQRTKADLVAKCTENIWGLADDEVGIDLGGGAIWGIGGTITYEEAVATAKQKWGDSRPGLLDPGGLSYRLEFLD